MTIIKRLLALFVALTLTSPAYGQAVHGVVNRLTVGGFSGTLAVDHGGTGATTAGGALDNFTGATTTGGQLLNRTGSAAWTVAPISANNVSIPNNLYGTNQCSATNYTAFGTCITVGVVGTSGAAAGFVNLLKLDGNFNTTNNGSSNKDACSLSDLKVFKLYNPSLVSSSLATNENGTNAAVSSGYIAYEPVYQTCHKSSVSWEGTPLENKIAAQNAACVKTGSWSTDSTYQSYGETTTTNGDSMACAITTAGEPIYAWYYLNDAYSGAFTYALDGGATTALNSFSTPTIASGEVGGVGKGIGFIRIPTSAGAHTVTFTVTSATGAGNTVGIVGVGTPPSVPGWNAPRVLDMGVLQSYLDQNSANTAAYNALNLADDNLLAGDGVPVTFVNVRCATGQVENCVQTTATDMSNASGQHMTDTGNLHYKQAIEAAVQFIQRTNTAYATPYTQNFSTAGSADLSQSMNTNAGNASQTTNFNPGLCIAETGSYNMCVEDVVLNSIHGIALLSKSTLGVYFGGLTAAPTSQANITEFGGIYNQTGFYTKGTIPVASSCGTNTVTTGSTNNSGQVNITAGTPSSCTITFGTAYGTKDFCVLGQETANTTFAYSYSLSAITLSGTALAGKYDWQCSGY